MLRPIKYKIGFINIQKDLKQGKYWKKPSYRRGDKILVNIKDGSCSLVMGIPTKEWHDIPSPGLVFYQTSSQAVLQMEANTYISQE